MTRLDDAARRLEGCLASKVQTEAGTLVGIEPSRTDLRTVLEALKAAIDVVNAVADSPNRNCDGSHGGVEGCGCLNELAREARDAFEATGSEGTR